MKIILITIFGSLGVLTRYFLDKTITNSGAFPWATLLSNCVGCLIIGLLFGLVEQKNPSPLIAPLMIGFCGGLTTFSSYSLQSLEKFTKGEFTMGLSYLFIAPILGLVLVYVGHSVTR